MNADNRERLRRLMGEAAALGPEDPQRRALQAEIAREGDWARKEWLELLRWDEQLRLELQRVPVPVGLERRLLALADEASKPRSTPWAWRAAAAAILLLACLGLVHTFLAGRNPDRQIREIALTAIADHMGRRHLAIETQDGSALLAALGPQVPFKVRLPDLGPDFLLLGGRKCTFNERPVLYTRWERGGYEYSLCQFCPKDFGLPRAFPGRTVAPGAGDARALWEARVWAQDGCAYVLVAEQGAFVPQVAKRSFPRTKMVLAASVLTLNWHFAN